MKIENRRLLIIAAISSVAAILLAVFVMNLDSDEESQVKDYTITASDKSTLETTANYFITQSGSFGGTSKINEDNIHDYFGNVGTFKNYVPEVPEV